MHEIPQESNLKCVSRVSRVKTVFVDKCMVTMWNPPWLVMWNYQFIDTMQLVLSLAHNGMVGASTWLACGVLSRMGYTACSLRDRQILRIYLSTAGRACGSYPPLLPKQLVSPRMHLQIMEQKIFRPFISHCTRAVIYVVHLTAMLFDLSLLQLTQYSVACYEAERVFLSGAG